MKKILGFVLSVAIFLSLFSGINGVEASHGSCKIAKTPIATIKINNKISKFKVPGLFFDKKSKLMMPIKPTAIALGYKWSIKGKAVKLTKGKSIITFTVGKNKALINKVKKSFPQNIIFKSNQVFVNSDQLKAFFNITSKWNWKTRILALAKILPPKPVIPPIPVLSGIKVRLDSNLLVYKGQDVYLFADGTPRIPLQLISDELGYTYTASTVGVIKLTKGSEVITLVAGEKKITVNGTVRNYDAASSLKSNTVCVSKEMITDIFKTPCDYFKDSKIVRVYTKPLADVKLYTILKDSGMYVSYWPNDPKENEYGDGLYPLGRMDCMLIQVSESPEPQELEITVFKPYPDIRNMLSDIYKIAYPNSYVELNRLTMATFLEEIYELPMPIYQNFPGTVKYNIDNRRFGVIKDLFTGLPPTNIYIGVKDYVYSPLDTSTNPSYKDHSANLQKYIKEYILGY